MRKYSVFLSVVLKRAKIYLCVLQLSGFGGLGVACWPLVPKFAVSNPAETIGF